MRNAVASPANWDAVPAGAASVVVSDPATVTAAVYELDAVQVAVPGRVLLQPVALRLPAGRVCGVIGLNGSGKSTLLKLLARQGVPTAGRIRFGGRPLAAWAQRDFARKVAYLPQQTAAADGFTVRELVGLGRYPWHGALGRFGGADRVRVEAAMEAAGVATFAERQVESLSGGERQRVWLAMLVAQESEWLLLDEPISALDVAHQVEVLSLVHHLSRTRGLGVVMVLHDINMAARFCDDLIALRAGRLIAQGTAAALMRAETLQDIYGIPMGILPHPATGAPLGFVC